MGGEMTFPAKTLTPQVTKMDYLLTTTSIQYQEEK